MQTNVLTPSPLPLDRFHWNKERRTLVAEASDFGPARDGHWWMGRLYNDAADIGIAIRSHHTDKIERFYLAKEHGDNEGDISHWDFKPVDKKCRVTLVTIIND